MKVRIKIQSELDGHSEILRESYGLSESQIKSIVFNVYESFRSVVNNHYRTSDVNTLRRFLHATENGQKDELTDEIIDTATRATHPYNELPIMLLRKVAERTLSIELDIIHKYFSCNSISKLLRYFSVSDSFITNYYIRNKTEQALTA